ncbi:YciI family protein [Demequina sp.]|uniref:YciI family protein n=1 Tax=Demequina sp. TaxID=2050685 RepID=UPI003D13DD29
MTQYVITFPARTMVLTDEEFAQAGIDANAVVEEMKAAGVYVAAGGIDPEAPAYLVSEDGSSVPANYPDTAGFNGGVTIIEVDSLEDAQAWAARIAKACRCPQEVRGLF